MRAFSWIRNETGRVKPEEYLDLQRVVYRVSEAVREEVGAERMYAITPGSNRGKTPTSTGTWCPCLPAYPTRRAAIRRAHAEEGGRYKDTVAGEGRARRARRSEGRTIRRGPPPRSLGEGSASFGLCRASRRGRRPLARRALRPRAPPRGRPARPVRPPQAPPSGARGGPPSPTGPRAPSRSNHGS